MASDAGSPSTANHLNSSCLDSVPRSTSFGAKPATPAPTPEAGGMTTAQSTFLAETLQALITDLESFTADETGLLSRMRARLAWAENLEQRSVERHQAAWARARAAIAAANGKTASQAYAQNPIELQPQLGLVPIGANPVTKLWEFYHLASGNPDRLPTHRVDGGIDLDAETGMIFVLLPGGACTIGAQSDDPNGLHYDHHASAA